MTLYSCRHDGDQYRISKFDDDMNVQSSYLCTVEECNCPAGVRPMCRHREMLPRFIARDTVGTDWFFDFDRGGWVQMEPYSIGPAITQGAVMFGDEWEAGLSPNEIFDDIPMTEVNGPHSAAASTADFDSADGGSNPPVAANGSGEDTGPELAPLVQPAEQPSDVVGEIEGSSPLRSTNRPLPTKHYPSWRRL